MDDLSTELELGDEDELVMYVSPPLPSNATLNHDQVQNRRIVSSHPAQSRLETTGEGSILLGLADIRSI